MSAAGAKTRLMAEYKSLQKEKWLNIEVGFVIREVWLY